MDYIILKSDGSLQTSSLNRYILQGSTGVDKIFVGWADALATDVVDVIFTLPNQTTKAEVYTQTYESNYNYDGEHTSKGWVVTLYSAETTYNGLLFAALRIIRGGIVQVCYPFTLVINETGVRPDADSGVTIEELDSYLVNIETLVGNAVRDNTDSQLSNTSENPVQNKVVKQAIDDAISGVYKIQGSQTVSGLNGLTKAETLNGYVYNMTDAGSLTNEDASTVSVQIGDNVVFVWNNGSWYWDRLSGVVDTSNLVTLNTDQTINSVKTLPQTTQFRFECGATPTQYKMAISSNDTYGLVIGRYTSNGASLQGGIIVTKDNLVPTGSGIDLGSSSKKWRDVYLSGSLSDGTHNIPVSEIATKIDTTDTLDLGTFDANGEITIAISDLEDALYNAHWGSELHGLYMLTYCYAQSIMYLDKTQIENASLVGSPIRSPMPVVYDALNSQSTPGNLRVKKVGSNYVFKVSDGTNNAAQGQHLYMIKTSLVA